MNNSQEILNELKEVSPLLAGLQKVNVFLVPDDYFSNLTERLSNFAIFNTINEFDLNKKNVQQVPDGYFDTLSTNILAKIREQYPETSDEELRSLSAILYSLKDENVFEIPVGYFDTLSTNILSKTTEQYPETFDEELRSLSAILYSLKDKNVFEIPVGYFDTLSTNILSKITEQYPETFDEELRSLSPILYSLKDKNVFEIPDGYFTYFTNNIIKKVKPASARIVSMRPRNSWLKIAVAAAVTGIIAIGSLQIFNNPSNPETALTASTEIPDYVKESFQFKTEQQLDAGIARLSDDDIIKYLEKNGSVLDNDILLKNADVSEMPSQEDYLNDENTLNSYLDKIDEKKTSN